MWCIWKETIDLVMYEKVRERWSDYNLREVHFCGQNQNSSNRFWTGQQKDIAFLTTNPPVALKRRGLVFTELYSFLSVVVYCVKGFLTEDGTEDSFCILQKLIWIFKGKKKKKCVSEKLSQALLPYGSLL